MSNRIQQIDFLRCVFIILMIIFHLVYIGDKYPYAKLVVYTFHMSAFLLISGYLVNLRRTPLAFARTMMWIFIPYAVMETGYVVMSSFLNVREGVDEVTFGVLMQKLFVEPIGPYWYLHTLVVCSSAYYAVEKVCFRFNVVSRLIILCGCLAGLAYGLHLLAFANAFYFVLGAAVYQSRHSFVSVFQPSVWAVVPLVVLCCFPGNLDRFTLAGVAITCLVISLLVWTYDYLPEKLRRSSLFIGTNTLPVLLFSPIFTILSKALIPFFAFDPTGMCFLCVAVVFVLGGSFAIAWVMDRLRLSRWFCGRAVLLQRM